MHIFCEMKTDSFPEWNAEVVIYKINMLKFFVVSKTTLSPFKMYTCIWRCEHDDGTSGLQLEMTNKILDSLYWSIYICLKAWVLR
jgi:hypothetical protein